MTPPPLYDTLWPWMHLVGRVLFGGLLLYNGRGHFTQTGALAGYAASKGVPAARIAVLASGAMLWLGCIFIVLGWHRFIGAGLVFLFLVPVAFMMHPFWKVPDPNARMMEQIQFLKDMALAGATLFIACYSGPSWPMSLGG